MDLVLLHGFELPEQDAGILSRGHEAVPAGPFFANLNPSNEGGLFEGYFGGLSLDPPRSQGSPLALSRWARPSPLHPPLGGCGARHPGPILR